MGTPANVEILSGRGFDDEALARATANDLVFAVIAADDDEALRALADGEAAVDAAGPSLDVEGTAPRPGSLEEAADADHVGDATTP